MIADSDLRSLSIYKCSYLDAVILLLLGMAIFFPSSIEGDFNRLDLAFTKFFFVITLLALLYFRFFKVSQIAVVMCVLIVFLYVFFTMLSKYSEYAYGYILSLFPVLILGLLRVKYVPPLRWILLLYYITVFLIFFLAYAGFILPSISGFMIVFYSGGYEGLAQRFQELFTPVSIFVSHSYAGFFYFLILFTSRYLISFGILRFLNILIIIACLISMLALKSGTSYFFFIYATLFLAFMTFFPIKRNIFSVSMFFLLLMVSIPVFIYMSMEFLPVLIDRIVGDSGNGLLSRYGEGVLKENIEYISENPFEGIGFSYSDSFYYTDSDYIVTFLKLGFFGGFLYFLYFYRFLYCSVIKCIGFSYFVFLFFAFVIFMISMPVSGFYRTTPFLLLLVLLFNAVDMSRKLVFGRCN